MILPIIYRHVHQGSEINSDGAKCYRSLIHMGYTHNVVIHKYEFVTDEGIHTNNIENVWSNLKSVFKKSEVARVPCLMVILMSMCIDMIGKEKVTFFTCY